MFHSTAEIESNKDWAIYTTIVRPVVLSLVLLYLQLQSLCSCLEFL